MNSCLAELALLPDDALGEVIVVVDGPAMNAFPAWVRDKRVRVLVLGVHRGTPVALNVGLNSSEATYIARLDSDDVAEPARLSKAVEYLEAHENVVAVGTQGYLIDPDGAEIGCLDMPVGRANVKRSLLRRNSLIHSSVVFRREAMLRVDGYDEDCLRMQDYDLFLRLALVGDLDNLSGRLINYRVHGGMSSKATSPYRVYTRRVLASRYSLYRASGHGRFSGFAHNTLWWVAQVLRHHGLRRPRYLGRASN
ncbi:glycosyltransferase [Terrabacter terrae]|uniref:Glycosyltransferase n=1 Tax=Terrabacter terrae TaxID=318434 RepID=A0ABN2TWR1_9MICO